jgi:hypothetical protein
MRKWTTIAKTHISERSKDVQMDKHGNSRTKSVFFCIRFCQFSPGLRKRNCLDCVIELHRYTLKIII